MAAEEQRMLLGNNTDVKQRKSLCSPVVTAVTFVCLAAAVALSVILVLIFVPHGGRVQYCTFTADTTLSFDGGRRTLHRQLFSAHRTKWASLTLAPSEPGSTFSADAGANGTRQVVDGTASTLIDVFFGRTVCHKLSQSLLTTMCVDTTNSAWVADGSEECPGDSGAAAGSICSKWKRTQLTTLGTQVSTIFVEKKSKLPRQYREVLGDEKPTVLNYLSFTVGDPPNSMFADPGDGVVCSNFLDTSNKYHVNSNMLVNDPLMVKAVSTAATERGWIAGASAAFDGMTVAEFDEMVWPHQLRYFGLVPGFSALGGDGVIDSKYIVPTILQSSSTIPTSFDSRNEWPKCQSISSITNQGKCGSCYAMAAAGVLSDRFCIALNASRQIVLSPQYIVSCFEEDLGCQGGFTEQTWKRLATHGTVPDSCVSFQGTWTQCPTTCDSHSGGQWNLYRSKNPSSFVGVTAIQHEIMAHGPVEATFWVFSDFKYLAPGGIYTRTGSSTLSGGHAVRIVGWGTSPTNQDFWIVANSWGSSWGSNGFFKIARGTNECGIEDHVVAGQALA